MTLRINLTIIPTFTLVPYVMIHIKIVQYPYPFDFAFSICFSCQYEHVDRAMTHTYPLSWEWTMPTCRYGLWYLIQMTTCMTFLVLYTCLFTVLAISIILVFTKLITAPAPLVLRDLALAKTHSEVGALISSWVVIISIDVVCFSATHMIRCCNTVGSWIILNYYIGLHTLALHD